MRTFPLLLIGLLIGAFACTHEPDPRFSKNVPFCAPRDSGLVDNDTLEEVSGLVASRKNPGTLWVHNDSGHPAEVYLISTRGKLLATYPLSGAENTDWEDIAIGPGPQQGETYLYVGDIGDNVSLYDERQVYRLVEPTYVPSSSATIDTIDRYDKLRFYYPEGARDAETLLLDPATQDLYVLSKEMNQIQVYRLPRFSKTTVLRRAQRIATLPLTNTSLLDRLVGGDISADGTEVLLKTYEHVLYWHRKDTTVALPALLQRAADTLVYWVEPQGEAIGFAADGLGYYTLSEQNFGSDIHLYFYPRCSSDSTEQAAGRTPPEKKGE